MSKLQSPCLHCENRQINCHSSCKQYKQFKHKLDIYNDELYKQKHIDDDYYGHITTMRKRYK